MRSKLTDEEIQAFKPVTKVGLLATLDPDDRPHVTLITSLAARSPSGLMWGQFCQGRSKDNIRRDPLAGFLVMTLDRRIWTGTARWTHFAREGEDYAWYNEIPMFRYNAYFGIHTVHYMDLSSIDGPYPLPLVSMVAAHAALTPASLLKSNLESLHGLLSKDVREGTDVLPGWARRFLSNPATLKFLAFKGTDGFPRIIPSVPCMPVGSRRLLLSILGNDRDPEPPAPGSTVSVFGLNLEMESLLTSGVLHAKRAVFRGSFRFPSFGTVEIDMVYNSMPPKHGRIFPRAPLEPVTSFGK